MNDLTAKISSIAMLALAALPMVALPASALAATTVKVSDLNVLSAEDAATFQVRADRAARDFCRNQRNIGLAESCREGVRQELTEKFSDLRLATLGQAAKIAAR
jgi:UrcA family protein